MSAKKVSPKKAIPAKKSVVKVQVKKAVPVKKAAPAKKAVPAKKDVAVKKAAPAKKATSKVAAPKKQVVKAPVPKKQVVKAPAKKAVPVKKAAPAKKVVAKKKPVEIKSSAKKTKAPIVAVKKAVPVKKTASAKKEKVVNKVPLKEKEVLKPSPAKKVPAKKTSKEETKSAKELNSNKKKISTKTDSKKASAASAKAEVISKEDVSVALPDEKNEKPSKQGKKGSKEEIPEIPSAKLLVSGKKPSKVAFFLEIDEQEDRLNKKKVSAEMKGLEKPTAAMRRKASLAEETPEELYQRVIQELEEKNQSFYREAATQVCTKCCVNIVSPEFRVDKDLGYCEECALLLGLGFTKEARKVDYQMGLMGGDSLDEDQEDDIEEKAPSIDELEDEDFDLEE